jgi:hypothetical protein
MLRGSRSTSGLVRHLLGVAALPQYVVVTVDDVTEVFVHAGLNNRVAFTDDPELVQVAVDSVARAECRLVP